MHNFDEFTKSKPVVVYMKGSPDFPQCGFSAHTISVLRSSGVTDEDMASFDVLSDETVRQGVKEFTNWPTIPQVFVNGQFVGGCDIVTEMAERGELGKLLKA